MSIILEMISYLYVKLFRPSLRHSFTLVAGFEENGDVLLGKAKT